MNLINLNITVHDIGPFQYHYDGQYNQYHVMHRSETYHWMLGHSMPDEFYQWVAYGPAGSKYLVMEGPNKGQHWEMCVEAK